MTFWFYLVLRKVRLFQYSIEPARVKRNLLSFRISWFYSIKWRLIIDFCRMFFVIHLYMSIFQTSFSRPLNWGNLICRYETRAMNSPWQNLQLSVNVITSRNCKFWDCIIGASHRDGLNQLSGTTFELGFALEVPGFKHSSWFPAGAYLPLSPRKW